MWPLSLKWLVVEIAEAWGIQNSKTEIESGYLPSIFEFRRTHIHILRLSANRDSQRSPSAIQCEWKSGVSNEILGGGSFRRALQYLSGNVEDGNEIGCCADDSFPKIPDAPEKNRVSVIRVPGSQRIRRGAERDVHRRWLLLCEHLCKPTNARVYSNDLGSQKSLNTGEIKFRTSSLSTLILRYPNIQKTCPGRFSQSLPADTPNLRLTSRGNILVKTMIEKLIHYYAHNNRPNTS